MKSIFELFVLLFAIVSVFSIPFGVVILVSGFNQRLIDASFVENVKASLIWFSLCIAPGIVLMVVAWARRQHLRKSS